MAIDHKVTFECEAITPIFVTGADQRDIELRSPSIKGVLRFWWRTLNGSLSVSELREKEAQIFGGVGKKEGRSKVVILVDLEDREIRRGEDLRRDYGLTWQFSGGRLVGRHAGIGYLVYAALINKRRFFFAKGSSKSGTLFSVHFLAKEIDVLQHTISAFWCLVFLGGLGLRSRRGGGNIAVNRIVDQSGIIDSLKLDFVLDKENQTEIANWIIRNFRIARAVVNENRKTSFISEYSNLSFSRFVISKRKFSSWIDALSDVGEKYQDFRYRHRRDIFDSGAFGLPVNHRRSGVKVIGKCGRSKINRRSSPLIFRVIRSKDSYYWMVIRLAGEFLPDGWNIATQYDEKEPNYRLIDEFWGQLKREANEFLLSVPDALNAQLQKIKERLSPSRIILFGSRARGDFHANSDINIAVETSKPIGLLEKMKGLNIVDLRAASDSLKKVIEREGVSLL